MKNYLWAIAMLIVSIIFIFVRPNPGMYAEVGAGIVWGFSVVWTYLGVRDMADNMWVRMAIATLAPLIIGIAGGAMIHIYEVTYLLILMAICAIHAHVFSENRPVGPFFHLIWMILYFITPATIWVINRSWWLVGASILIRFVFYNPVLNKFRGRPFFYLSVNSRNPSLWDHIEIAWAGAYPWIWGIGVLGLIIIQFFI